MSVNSMDPYKARQDVTEKMLLEELEAQSHNSDTSDNEYVPSEHCEQEECDNVSTPEIDFYGDNVTTSDDSETDRGYEPKNGQIWNKQPLL